MYFRMAASKGLLKSHLNLPLWATFTFFFSLVNFVYYWVGLFIFLHIIFVPLNFVRLLMKQELKKYICRINKRESSATSFLA